MTLKKNFSVLSPVDFISILFIGLLTILNLIFYGRVPHGIAIIAVNFFVVGFILLLAHFAKTRKTKLVIGVHRWYAYWFVLFVFKEIYLMLRPIHPVDFDWLLIAIDHWMFGVNPTQWAAQFAHPVLTEIFQIAYFSYYLLFIMLGVEIYKRLPLAEFDRSAFFIVYGFYLSYVGYFLLPAVGPRFTLHNFYAINQELPGLFFTPWMRDFVNAGESVSFSMPNALALVQRDVFPSGHTELTLIVLYLNHHYKLKLRWLATILGTLLIVSTIYLRYHYVIDLIGGTFFFFFAIWSGKKIQSWWERQQQRWQTA
ncbi:MAG TPA: phosphatase PAP2 family protein [Bacteroidota bacterium]|nr:phosphatase PAP2 family protein [Bacteroidota bacterium]